MAFDNLSDNPLNYVTYLNINGVIQDGISTNRQYLNTYSDTGIISFSGLSFSSTNTINVGACKAWIVDNETDALFPTKTYIEYSGETNVPVTTMTGTNVDSYVLLTSTPSIQFMADFPISSERKSAVLLGRVSHPNNAINFITDKPDFNISPNSQVRDIFKVLSLINGGVVVNFNGNNLNVNLTGGILYGYGINYVNDKTNPNSYLINSATTASFAYRTQTGGTSGFVNLIDPTNYDVNGEITPISGTNTSATIQYIYYVPNYGLGIQRGQTVYDTLDDAVAAIGKETSFNVYTNLEVNGILIGMLAVTKSATTLNDTSQAVFVRTDKFGQAIGVAGGRLNRTDYYTTGLTFNNATYDLTVSLNNGDSYTQSLSILASDVTITGGSYNPNTGSVTFSNSTGGTFTITGFTSGMTDTFTTGGTFDNVTDTITFTKNDNTTYSVTGLTDYYTTGATVINNQVYFDRNDALSAYTFTLPSGMTDTYITGGTFVNNTLTLTNNTGGTINTLIDNFSGLTVSGVTFNKLLLEKVGSVSGSSFAGNPKTYSVIFDTDFPDTNYAITLGGEVERSWYSTNKTISGFTFNAGANTAFSGLAYYIAKQIGEV